MSEVRLAVEQRTEFGKGAARRTRRAGKIPAVLYGHGSDPKHLALPALEFARLVREHGQNAVFTLDIASGEPELALTKTITVHPIKNYIEHVDLLLIKRGEKVTVDVPIVVVGEPGPGTLLTQDAATISLEAEAMHIPDNVEVSVDSAEVGTQIFAKDITLPTGSSLVTDGETLVINIVAAPTAEQMEGADDTGDAAEQESAEDAPAEDG